MVSFYGVNSISSANALMVSQLGIVWPRDHMPYPVPGRGLAFICLAGGSDASCRFVFVGKRNYFHIGKKIFSLFTRPQNDNAGLLLLYKRLFSLLW